MKKHLQIMLCLLALAAASQLGNAQEQKKDSAYLLNTTVFGATLGTPGVFNIIGGHYWKKAAIRLEVGGIPLPVGLQGWFGAQANLSSVVMRDSNSEMEFSFLSMYYYIPLNSLGETEYLGFGGSWSINYYGFFFELGITFGNRSHRGALMPVLQFGYVQ